MDTPRFRPYAQVAVAATAWGTWSIFLRPAHVDPRWASAIVLTVVAVAAAPAMLRPAGHGSPDGRKRGAVDVAMMLALGVVDAANAVLFFAAMQVTTIAVAVLSHYLAPVIVALLAPWALGTERRKGAAGLAVVGVFGLTLVLEPWHLSSADTAAGRPLLGAAMGAGSALFYAANVFLAKRMVTRFTAEEQLVWHSIVSAILLGALAVFLRVPLPVPVGALRVGIGGLVVGATAGLLFLYGLRKIPAEHVGMLTFLEPLTAVLVAWAAFGERPGPAAMLGGVIVLTAGALAMRESDRTSTPR